MSKKLALDFFVLFFVLFLLYTKIEALFNLSYNLLTNYIIFKTAFLFKFSNFSIFRLLNSNFRTKLI